jgi:hypothetical protein
MLARIRKAIVAGAGAALAAFISAMVNSATEGQINRDEVLKALGVALVAGLTVFGATYGVRNEGSDIGPTGSEIGS